MRNYYFSTAPFYKFEFQSSVVDSYPLLMTKIRAVNVSQCRFKRPTTFPTCPKISSLARKSISYSIFDTFPVRCEFDRDGGFFSDALPTTTEAQFWG